MQDVSRSAATVLLQSILVAGGGLLGFCQAFRSERGEDAVFWALRAKPADAVPPYAHDLLARVEKLERVQGWISPQDLNRSIERMASELRGEIDSRFEAQNRAIESLRDMTGHTGELIERLLDRLDAAGDSVNLHHIAGSRA